MTGDDSKTTEYKLSFSANGGTGEMESIAKEENEKINLPAVKFSRTGFEFLNWNTVADGSGTAYADYAIENNVLRHGKQFLLCGIF